MARTGSLTLQSGARGLRESERRRRETQAILVTTAAVLWRSRSRLLAARRTLAGKGR